MRTDTGERGASLSGQFVQPCEGLERRIGLRRQVAGNCGLFERFGQEPRQVLDFFFRYGVWDRVFVPLNTATERQQRFPRRPPVGDRNDGVVAPVPHENRHQARCQGRLGAQ